ncbi:MAG: hypothetical protein LBK97_01975 [Prevotellaceae bacterium]|jgi:hypothetical protein|nr:hypothetical protein [Prevotellaceae bacterium]
MELMWKTERLKVSLSQYNSYDYSWERAYFDGHNGGYLVICKERITQGNINKQEKEKYDKEYSMCMILVQNGYRVEYLKMTEGSFDIYLNGKSADLKKTAGSGNIVKYAKKAIEKQGAEIVVFEFEKETARIKEELKVLKEKGTKVKYYFSNNPDKIMDL